MSNDLSQISERFDHAVLDLLGPIRMKKQVDDTALATMTVVLDDLAAALKDQAYVPKKLVGNLWYVFTAILAESGHTKDPAPLLSAAWQIQERLERIFGPR